MKREQVLPHVMADMAARIAKGADDYGEPLTTFNGRDALQDAYEEALDLAMYLKQALMERAKPWPAYGPSRESIAAVTSPESAAILADVPVIQGGWPGPDWSQAPDVSHFTHDRINGWKMGCHGIAFWLIGGGIWGQAPTFNYPGDWRDSLRKRPE